jgi:hypothetical protein
LAPFGQENPPLLFCSRRVHIIGTKALGRTREHFQFQLEDDQGQVMQAVWWNTTESEIPAGWFDLAYSLNINEYKGRITLQAVWTDFHIVEEAEEIQNPVESFRLIDFRSHPEPLTAARLACKEEDYLIYQEPYDLDDPLSCGRDQLHPASTLIQSSIPPSWQVFDQIVSRVNPKRIYLVFDKVTDHTVNSFLKQLFARIRYAVDNRNGVVTCSDLAQVMNTRLETAESAVDWLVAAGKISIKTGDSGMMGVEIQNSAPSREETARVENKLQFLIKDTGAFQREIRKNDVASLSSSLGSLKITRRR